MKDVSMGEMSNSRCRMKNTSILFVRAMASSTLVFSQSRSYLEVKGLGITHLSENYFCLLSENGLKGTFKGDNFESDSVR